MSDSDGEKVQKNLRLPPALLDELRNAAKREKRSESAIIELALEEYFERQNEADLPDELKRAVEQYLERHR